MSADPGGLERILEFDLDQLFATLTDDWSSVELFRALTNTPWTKAGGMISLSPERSAELINTLRARHGKKPLELLQSGGYGEVSDRAGQLFNSVGWTLERPRRFDRRRAPRSDDSDHVITI